MPIEKGDFYPDFFDDDNDDEWYLEPRDTYPAMRDHPREDQSLTLTERLSLARYAAARFLRRAWQRCPDCGRLELVGEHEGCIPF